MLELRTCGIRLAVTKCCVLPGGRYLELRPMLQELNGNFLFRYKRRANCQPLNITMACQLWLWLSWRHRSCHPRRRYVTRSTCRLTHQELHLTSASRRNLDPQLPPAPRFASQPFCHIKKEGFFIGVNLYSRTSDMMTSGLLRRPDVCVFFITSPAEIFGFFSKCWQKFLSPVVWPCEGVALCL